MYRIALLKILHQQLLLYENSYGFSKIKFSRCLHAGISRQQNQQNSEEANVLRKRKFVPPTPSQRTSDLLPQQARVVICGGGIAGCSVAYHLALLGWGKDTLLIDQHTVGDGPLCSSGFVGCYQPTYNELKLAEYSVKLITELTEKGLPTGWRQVGSLNLSRSFDRMTTYRRMKSVGVAWGMPCKLLSPEECKVKCPLIATEDLHGGLWIPNDGICDPQLVCQTFLNEAMSLGVQVIEHCAVNKIHSASGKVSHVETTCGTVTCEYFVNCAGFWAREVGTLSSPPVKIPLKSVEHHLLYTKPITDLDPMTPFVRDYDGRVYFREKDGAIMAGWFQTQMHFLTSTTE